ncbi:MAG: hypothetical protein AAF351_04505 [Pseudomonadota bacterium]
MNWREFLEFVCKILVGGLFVYAGFYFVEDFEFTVVGQVIFWPIFLLLAYWLVIREIYIPRAIKGVSSFGSVVVEFSLNNGEYGSEDERAGVHRLAEELDALTKKLGVGDYDGDEFGAGKCRLFFYTDNPDALYAAIEPHLRRSVYADGMTAMLTEPAELISSRTVRL